MVVRAPGMMAKFHTAVMRLACSSAVAILAACATQPVSQPPVPGFAAGLFHGFAAIIALLGSLYFHIRIYAFPNSGFWYDAGFVLGFSLNIILVIILLAPRIGALFTRGR